MAASGNFIHTIKRMFNFVLSKQTRQKKVIKNMENNLKQYSSALKIIEKAIENVKIGLFELPIAHFPKLLDHFNSFVISSMSLGSKVKLMRFLVVSIFLFASESWLLTAE